MISGAREELEEPSATELSADILMLARLLSVANQDLSGSVLFAESLVRTMGCTPAVLEAPPTLLQKKGLTPAQIALIQLIREAMEICLRRRMERRPLINSSSKAIDYLHRKLAFDYREKLAVIFMTRRMRFLHYEEISLGSIASTPYCTRTIAARALEVNAGAIIVAHNHPSGSPEPSEEDRQMGHVLQRLCADLDIRLVDNIIISSTGSVSVMEQGRTANALRQMQNDVGLAPTC